MTTIANSKESGPHHDKDEDEVDFLMKEAQHLESKRTSLDNLWDEIRLTVRPTASDFYAGYNQGEEDIEEIYDSTAMWASENLANGLHSNLTSAFDRWFNLVPLGINPADLDQEAKVYLETVSDIMYHHFSLPDSGFVTATHENYLDIVVFGNGTCIQEKNLQSQSVEFTSFPTSSCFYKVNNRRKIDTVYRKFTWNVRQIRQEWGDEAVKKLEKAMQASNKKLNEGDEVDLWHAVMPNHDKDLPNKGSNKPFTSYYFTGAPYKVILSQGGFDIFPYHIGRWSLTAGNVYGTPPSVTALPDIRTLNTMNRDLLRSAQLNLVPPLVMEDDGFIPPIEYLPASIIFKTPGTEAPQQLPTGGRFDITLEMMNQKREMISKAYYMDYLLRPKKKERQTTTEIMDDREEMFQQLGPMLARLEKEYLTPLIQSTFYHLNDMGVLPEPPRTFQNQPLRVTYTGPAVKAQTAVKATNIQRYLQDIIPLLQIDQSLIMAVDLDNLSQELAVYRDVTQKVLRSPEAIAELKAQQEAEKQAEMMASQAPDLAGALKDTAQAGATASDAGLL